EVDACVLGEGENKMIALLEAWDKGIPKSELPGIAFFDRRSGAVKLNPLEDGNYRISRVDAIPRPAWDLFPLEQYLDSRSSLGSRNHRAMPMLASRGCPYRCTFCSSPQMWTTKWKAREVRDLVDEVKGYIRKYGIDRVEFYDLSMFIDSRWIVEFCSTLIEENLN